MKTDLALYFRTEEEQYATKLAVMFISLGGAPTAATAKIGETVDNREKEIAIGKK